MYMGERWSHHPPAYTHVDVHAEKVVAGVNRVHGLDDKGKPRRF
jgi:hypothetical protein